MFGSVYPALEELKQPLSEQQLNVLRNQLKAEEPKPSPQTQFNYAWGLIKSPTRKHQQEAVVILTKLYKTEPSMRREVLYYLSLGSFKLGDYTNAKRYVETLLKSEPENQQALGLLENIEDKVTQEGLIGIGVAGGVLAVGIGIVGALFNELTVKSGKPEIRSNGIEEWTVLSSVVAITRDEIIPITLSTGVKVLPDRVRNYPDGRIVHDMHAEILSLRLFNYFLLEEASKKQSKWVNRIQNKYKFRDDVKLALFVSEPPCGDVSMNYLSSSLISSEAWEVSSSNNGFHRGRNNFDQLGVVRTKPGRTDSLISYSKSCSDKICLKQLTGICNASSAHIFDPIYLDYLVVNKVDSIDFNRCFRDRFQLGRDVHYLQLLTHDDDAYKFHKSDEKEPSPLSLLYIVPYNFHQVLNNGVKNGAFIKNKAPRRGGESIICNKSIMNKLCQVCQITQPSYSLFKMANTERQTLKSKGQVSLQNWRHTSIDDFNL
ncbi:hypothetical protein CANMA_004322 [Candida margitis]|uniref:uncharacterized protein n=1 Tax=Candida margitis TaxID=1775924 RepID=UPI0022269173|nr:uncharacterized protein CANMA_004322 [Candida margitis]KAI5958168.1 hypothetical protein CANMA_004322 [Candida margitis]